MSDLGRIADSSRTLRRVRKVPNAALCSLGHLVGGGKQRRQYSANRPDFALNQGVPRVIRQGKLSLRARPKSSVSSRDQPTLRSL
jgi:hypothetical protein